MIWLDTGGRRYEGGGYAAVRFVWIAGLVLAACGPSASNSSGPGDGGTDSMVACEDQDNDTICDADEGIAEDRDSDNDGTPDYLDSDSDDDGLPDSLEAGDDDTATAPADSDRDGIPNFIDEDSDDNGIPDEAEGPGDADSDGIPDYADLDDDGDTILDAQELGADPMHPVDSDDDGTPDFRDTDSDDDTIADLYEANADTDGDGTPDYLDDDSDNDGLLDAIEAGDSDEATPPIDSDQDGLPDFRDVDSDDDGLADGAEDANHDGHLDPGESDPTKSDTDGDGVTDLIEVAAGTDPQNSADNPRANGDFVFLEPYQEAPDPTDDKLAFSTTFKAVDLYILEDVSGSMEDEISSVRTSLISMIDAIVCGPGEDPVTDYCIPDVESGCGRFGYVDPVTHNVEIWHHLKDINSDHQATQSALPSTAYGGTEQHVQALRGTVTGACASDNTRIGTACFRTDSLALIIMISDEDFREDTTYLDGRQSTYDLLANDGIRVVGVTGNDDYNELGTLRADFLAMRGGNPQVDLVPGITNVPNTPQCNAIQGNPFYSDRAVVSGPDSQAANAMTCAIQAVTAYLPQDVSTLIINDATNQDKDGNPVDAVTAFVDHIEVFQDGSQECSDGNQVVDTDSDGHPDMFQAILPGTPVCWKLYVKQNDTVEPSTEMPLMFRATVEVHGEGGAVLDSRDVYFLVPPIVEQPNPG